ncbi:DMT family transporter [Bailinhaonella thermotolerans]|uniref:Magnesium transporter NIPA n=1 Tax=Bailinhaonella thermotolerans TaxID=1070861 RepID=A0A3A4B1P5_9ACTN|nr:DMT family transporter [Bailinhaonella thermotolerans]RJL32023.1 hypothetical protein D5H75_16450 [Bailinhaonella thermotolerans]
MTGAWLGLAIALAGAFGYALGAALQQYEAVNEGASLSLVRRPRWWIGGVIGFTGASLHALSLSMAPLTLIQPISVATLLFAVPLAAVLHGRRPRRAEMLGSALVAAGLLGLMLLMPGHAGTPHLSSGSALGFLGVIALVVIVTQVWGRAVHGSARALVFAVGAGAVTATVSTFVRVVGAGMTEDFSRVLHWFTLAIPLILVGAVVLLQQSYAVGYFGIAYAGVQVVDPITSVTAGVVLLGEPLPTDPWQAVPAVLAAAVLITGTVILGRLTPDHSHKKPAPAPLPDPAPEPASP